MTFLAPWWLLGLALVPAFLLWGVLAPRGRRVTVGSLLLWRRALAGGATGRPTARLRLRDPLLWLDASCIALAILACARPAFHTDRPLDPVATVVLDRTASMEMPSDGPRGTRVLDAWAMARDALAALPDAPVRLVSVPGEAGTPAAETTTLRRLFDADDPADGVRMASAEVWRTAAVRAAADRNRPVVLVTDVAPPGEVPPNVYVLAPGTAAGERGNAGLVRVAARVADDRWWLLVAARASAGAAGPFGLAVSTGEAVHAERDDFLAPGAEAETVVAMDGPPPPRLHVRLAGPPDAFAPDNEAFLVLEPGGVTVRLLGNPPGPSLQRAFEAAGATVRSAAVDIGLPGAEAADLLVACGVPPPDGWMGPAAVIAPPEAVGPVRPGEGTLPAEWRVAEDHPLAEAFYLPPPRLDEVPRYRVEPSARVLVGTAEAPLMVTWETEGARRLAVCFPLDDDVTDWPRRAGFPVFWARAVDWLVPAAARTPACETYAPLAPVPGTGRTAPGRTGFHPVGGRTVGVSFIGTDEGFQSGPGRDDSAAAAAAIRASIAARREAAFDPAWPWAAVLVLLALAARAWVAR